MLLMDFFVIIIGSYVWLMACINMLTLKSAQINRIFIDDSF